MESLDLTGHWMGWAAVVVFLLAYIAVTAEEFLRLRKSVSVLLAAGVIWSLIGLAYAQRGDTHSAAAAARHNVLEFAELFLFLIVAMTFVNTLGERGVFHAIRSWLVGLGLSLRALFWATGAMSFIISPIADNLTTALLMGAVASAVGQGKPAFVSLACINIVVAANAGGAFSPFGDITTLMVWQAGIISFGGFFPLTIPSLVNWLVPAVLMSFAVEQGQPVTTNEKTALRAGAWTVAALFIGTIALTVSFRNFLHLPPALGMMTGLGILKMYSYGLNANVTSRGDRPAIGELDDAFATSQLLDTDAVRQGGSDREQHPGKAAPIDILKLLEKIEWDTLMFFYGILLCVGGLGTLGYLSLGSTHLYDGLGATWANVIIGLLSAVVDNVPVMFAVLSMNPEMSQGQWLLVTLTAGVGGSILSFGSAAGVALMGQARGTYTFLSHMKWSWAIALGYAASIGVHFLINNQLF